MKFKIPAKPYIEKFVFARNQTVLTAGTSTADGNFVLTLLRTKGGSKLEKQFEGNCKAHIYIEVGDREVSRYSFKGFSPKAVSLFHRKYDTEFLEALYVYVNCMVDLGVTRMQALRQFLEINELEKVLTLDAIKKRELRYRKQKENAQNRK